MVILKVYLSKKKQVVGMGRKEADVRDRLYEGLYLLTGVM
jgi:hypothetical protein